MSRRKPILKNRAAALRSRRRWRRDGDSRDRICGTHDRLEHELCLAVEDVDPTRRQEPLDHRHRRALPQRPCSFHRVAFRKKIYAAIDDLQANLDLEARPHPGKRRFGKAPLQTFLDAPPNREKKKASRSLAVTNPPPHDRHRPAHAVRGVK